MKPGTLRGALKSIATKVAKYNEEELSQDARFSDFFRQVLPKIDKTNILKLQILIFMDALLKFLKIHIVFPNSGVILCNYKYSSQINKCLMKNYCLTRRDGSLRRPWSLRTKALRHILVLLLLVFDFVVDITILSAHMSKPDYQKLPRLLRAVGAEPIYQ